MFSDASWISDPDALLQQVLDIQENAQYCDAFNRPEACWGTPQKSSLPVSSHAPQHEIQSSSIPKKSTTVSSSHPLPKAKLAPEPNSTLCPTQLSAQLNSLPNPTQNLDQTGRPEHATSAILLSIEIRTYVSVDDSLLQLAVWASAGLQAVSNVFDGNIAPDIVRPAFMMSMKGAACKISYMKLESSSSEEDLPAKKLYGDNSIWNAGTVTGIFKIFACWGFCCRIASVYKMIFGMRTARFR
ncbi:uncharacterized protein PAC_18490 [Phialocephala subalpina]|uniref:PD-(D/E)XK nuclease-like domain-containing protein n=1 Tax=Phialocephala subalpina TaxID=576137 RepID=A0A1L7XU83_9HELO|nr:uncharacterized protein PAC_18490 [Phialocephala subalpina]